MVFLTRFAQAQLCALIRVFFNTRRVSRPGRRPDANKPVRRARLTNGAAMVRGLVTSSAADERKRFKFIVNLDLLLTIGMLVSWVPYFISIASV